MCAFVPRGSIVRRIWGDADTVLLVFAESAAEFALNRAVDWLFFTGELPHDPVGRLFDTARYAQDIVFADQVTAERALARIRAIHGGVESRREQRIPDCASRDVFYLLTDYSERAFRLLQRPLTAAEQQELYAVFRRVRMGLGIGALPGTYAQWQLDRQRHLERDLAYSHHTAALYRAYRRHLGSWRYALLLQVQRLLVPRYVRQLLRLQELPLLRLLIPVYPAIAKLGLRPLLHRLLLPPRYLGALRRLEQPLAEQVG